MVKLTFDGPKFHNVFYGILAYVVEFSDFFTNFESCIQFSSSHVLDMVLLVKVSATATTDASCESVVLSDQHQQQNPTPHLQRDANNPARYSILVS